MLQPSAKTTVVAPGDSGAIAITTASNMATIKVLKDFPDICVSFL